MSSAESIFRLILKPQYGADSHKTNMSSPIRTCPLWTC
jgi:hypothetical protein